MISNRFLRVGLVGLLFCGLCSCESGDKSIGGQFLSLDGNVVLIDTFTVNLSSFTSDSVVTSGKSVILAGETTDPIFGETQSRSYVVFGWPYDIGLVSETAEVDSFVLGLTYTGYYYGDTLKDISLNIHQLKEEVKFNENTSALYNSSSFLYESNPIGGITFLPRPKSKEEITIPLSNELGNNFLNLFKKYSDVVTSDETFADFFKGVVIVPSRGGAIVGFDVNDTSLFLKLYYHVSGVNETESSEITFEPYRTDRQFNQTITNKKNTSTAQLNKTPTSSENTMNCSYIQGGTSVVTRVDIPSLREVLYTHKNMQILSANLVIQPTPGQREVDLPESLNIYYSNKHNEFFPAVTTTGGSSQDGNLSVDYVFPENTAYTWDITDYVKKIISNNTILPDGMLIVPETYSTAFDRVVFSNQLKSKYKTKLKIYTITYE